jgi:hypothetical protein
MFIFNPANFMIVKPQRPAGQIGYEFPVNWQIELADSWKDDYKSKTDAFGNNLEDFSVLFY